MLFPSFGSGPLKTFSCTTRKVRPSLNRVTHSIITTPDFISFTIVLPSVSSHVRKLPRKRRQAIDINDEFPQRTVCFRFSHVSCFTVLRVLSTRRMLLLFMLAKRKVTQTPFSFVIVMIQCMVPIQSSQQVMHLDRVRQAAYKLDDDVIGSILDDIARVPAHECAYFHPNWFRFVEENRQTRSLSQLVAESFQQPTFKARSDFIAFCHT